MTESVQTDMGYDGKRVQPMRDDMIFEPFLSFIAFIIIAERECIHYGN